MISPLPNHSTVLPDQRRLRKLKPPTPPAGVLAKIRKKMTEVQEQPITTKHLYTVVGICGALLAAVVAMHTTFIMPSIVSAAVKEMRGEMHGMLDRHLEVGVHKGALTVDNYNQMEKLRHEAHLVESRSLRALIVDLSQKVDRLEPK